jgi:hypothetical protein
MRALIFCTGTFGIAGITLVAYRMAKTAAADCPMTFMDNHCVEQANAHRDAVLVYGLSAMLAFILVSMIVMAALRVRGRQGQGNGFSFRSANRERRHLLRP